MDLITAQPISSAGTESGKNSWRERTFKNYDFGIINGIGIRTEYYSRFGAHCIGGRVVSK
ncbi:MAG TPA: hypothetical protein VGO67_08545 [Verrucomicrobiae bacterium]